MSYQTIIYETAERIATITLNRPQRMNALSPDMLAELSAALTEANKDNAVRVVIIKGAGNSFCGGYDLAAPPFNTNEQLGMNEIRAWLQQTVANWFNIIWNYPKTVVTQVHGYCLGGGVELAVMSDLTVVAEDAKLGSPPSRVHGPEAVVLYPFLAGLKKAKELMLTGDSISGIEAVQLGMANRAVPLAQLEEATLAMARRVANVEVEVSSLNKASINKTYELMGVRSAMEWAADMNTLGWLTNAGLKWNELVREKGLRAAVEERDRPFNQG